MITNGGFPEGAEPPWLPLGFSRGGPLPGKPPLVYTDLFSKGRLYASRTPQRPWALRWDQGSRSSLMFLVFVVQLAFWFPEQRLQLRGVLGDTWRSGVHVGTCDLQAPSLKSLIIPHHPSSSKPLAGADQLDKVMHRLIQSHQT